MQTVMAWPVRRALFFCTLWVMAFATAWSAAQRAIAAPAPVPSNLEAAQRIRRALHTCVEVKRLHPVRPGSMLALAEVQWCGRANTLDGLVLLGKDRIYNLEDRPSDADWSRALAAAHLAPKSGDTLSAFHAPVLLSLAADGSALRYARAFASCHACAVEAVGYARVALHPRLGRATQWRIERVEAGSAWPPPGAQAALP